MLWRMAQKSLIYACVHAVRVGAYLQCIVVPIRIYTRVCQKLLG